MRKIRKCRTKHSFILVALMVIQLSALYIAFIPTQINREVSRVRQATDRVATDTHVSVRGTASITCLRTKTYIPRIRIVHADGGSGLEEPIGPRRFCGSGSYLCGDATHTANCTAALQ